MAANATARGLAGKAVMNMSIGGSKSAALNSAVAALTKAGVTVVVAAGNENVSLRGGHCPNLFLSFKFLGGLNTKLTMF